MQVLGLAGDRYSTPSKNMSRAIKYIGNDYRILLKFSEQYGAPVSGVLYNAWEGEGERRYPADMLLRRPQEEYQVRFR